MRTGIVSLGVAAALALGCSDARSSGDGVAPAARKGLPVALSGYVWEIQSLQMDVTAPAHITTKKFRASAPVAAELSDYAAIVLGRSGKDFSKAAFSTMSADTEIEAYRQYVAAGGTVVVLHNLGHNLAAANSKWGELIGVDAKEYVSGAASAVRIADVKKAKPYLWADALSLSARGVRPGTEVLVEAELAGGKKLAVATRRREGKGSVYWIGMSWALYDMKFSAKKKVAGEADEKGVFVLSPDGESQAALNAFLREIFLGLEKIDTAGPKNNWALKALGEPGRLKLESGFKNTPVFGKAPVFKPGIAFWTKDVKGVVVAPWTNSAVRALGNEIAWHLSEMTGAKVPVVTSLSHLKPAQPAIVLGDALICREFGVDSASLKRGTALLKRKGERLLVYGRGSGQGYAATYLLEALGCRYLWPGRTGKVIPKRSEIVLPDVELDYVPAYKVRGMRDFTVAYRSTPDASGLKAFWGIDPKEFAPVYAAGIRDAKGNRDFWRWHGVNDERDLAGNYAWGHYFGDYWQKYGKDHPDWFALQVNGSREQELVDRPERPTLCLSNRGLVEQTAKDAIAAFKAEPNRASFSLCLPDGGHTTQCMCEECRRLDPVNSPAGTFHVGSPWWRSFPYVSLTDRVMTFNNAVAEIVTRECPGKRLCCYIYSMYEKPPVKVKPHPSLTLLSCAGSIMNDAAADNIAVWSRITSEILWRPNTLFAFSVSAPQNYARRLFRELELFKVNNVVGTDFDCVNAQFANKGLVFYMMARAHRNPDRLGYDDIYADYCRHGFGAAADDVKAYFDALEKMTEAGIAAKKGNNGFLACLDVEKLSQILERAEKSAAGDGEVLARIGYLRRGVEAGRIEKRLGAAWTAKDRKGVLSAQRELREFVRKSAFEEPSAINPIWVSGFYHSPNMKGPNF